MWALKLAQPRRKPEPPYEGSKSHREARVLRRANVRCEPVPGRHMRFRSALN